MNKSTLDKHRRTEFDGARWEKDYHEITEPIHAGNQFEESGNDDAAVVAYMTSIEIGERIGDIMFHAYRHAYERIIALLRRTPDVATLEQYCRAYITHPVDESTRIRINNIIQTI